ncbi:hypothetical protein DL96DRAFT_1561250 [Flagelloscypha sp. PMI_526]|nr:hypothetical protein DL96DRAFT_1561250 [Flagelloscypha sp. PMI_526]
MWLAIFFFMLCSVSSNVSCAVEITGEMPHPGSSRNSSDLFLPDFSPAMIRSLVSSFELLASFREVSTIHKENSRLGFCVFYAIQEAQANQIVRLAADTADIERSSNEELQSHPHMDNNPHRLNPRPQLPVLSSGSFPSNSYAVQMGENIFVYSPGSHVAWYPQPAVTFYNSVTETVEKPPGSRLPGLSWLLRVTLLLLTITEGTKDQTSKAYISTYSITLTPISSEEAREIAQDTTTIWQAYPTFRQAVRAWEYARERQLTGTSPEAIGMSMFDDTFHRPALEETCRSPLTVRHFYCVSKGIRPGVYGSWLEAGCQVIGQSRPDWKKFPTWARADAHFGSSNPLGCPPKVKGTQCDHKAMIQQATCGKLVEVRVGHCSEEGDCTKDWKVGLCTVESVKEGSISEGKKNTNWRRYVCCCNRNVMGKVRMISGMTPSENAASSTNLLDVISLLSVSSLKYGILTYGGP